MAGIVKDSWGAVRGGVCAWERPQGGKGSVGLERRSGTRGWEVRSLPGCAGGSIKLPRCPGSQSVRRTGQSGVDGGGREVSSTGHLGSINSRRNTTHRHPENSTGRAPAPQVPVRNPGTTARFLGRQNDIGRGNLGLWHLTLPREGPALTPRARGGGRGGPSLHGCIPASR